MRRAGLVGLLLSCCFPTAGFAGPAVHALLINGGDKPASNYLSHFHHLEDMVDVLRRRGVDPERIHVFSADGEDPAPDLTRRDVPPADFWLLEGTALGNRLKPQAHLTDSRWAGVTLLPAREAALRNWFEDARKRFGAGDELLLFVTDHGTGDPKNPDNNAISLWNEKLTVRELETLLARLPPGVRVVMVMSQCYSGAFANVAIDAKDRARDVCGFFSTTGDRKAYGCYPEGRDRDRMGHAFHFIDALARNATSAEAHAEVLAEDDTPDAPLRTSDAYLARIVADEAVARGMEADALVDTLLARAWRARAEWEPEIRLLDGIGTAFGTFSPRYLHEVAARDKELQAITKQMSSYADRWKLVHTQLREAVVASFVKADETWRQRLEPGALARMSPDERSALLVELLPALEQHARSRADLWPRIERFRDHASRGAEAEWRLEVRQAALRRMRTILVSIAGRVLIGGETRRAPDQARLAKLEECEAFAPGKPPDRAVRRTDAPRPFPPLKAELALLEEISPSWLGVRFRAIPAAVRAERGLSAGANLLDAVYPDSAAERAGVEVGDIVLGPPGRPFEAPHELREWSMTAPRDVPLPMVILRPGETVDADRELEVELTLGPTPVDLPRLPSPPLVGERAPTFPGAVKVVGGSDLPDLAGRPHLLFFWATWCGPCKKAVPEVMALAASRGVDVLAISDEDEETVSRFLAGWEAPFIRDVAVDPLRKTFVAYGVSGTPTVLLVDGGGVIRHRQVGYGEDGLTVEGWSWPRR